MAEVMIHPYRNGDAALIANFKNFFTQKNFLTVADHNNDLLDISAMFAGQRKMKMIDAIHVATAQKKWLCLFSDKRSWYQIQRQLGSYPAR